MSIQILQAGFLTTIQDIGRYGSQKYGVTVGGAMDILALQIANILVGNTKSESALEVTMSGTEIKANSDHLIAITGGNLEPTIDGIKVPMWRPLSLKKGQILKFNSIINGFRTYISFASGFNVPKIMGSKSTCIKAKIGGYKGRPLKRGDILNIMDFNEKNKKIYNLVTNRNSSINWTVNYPPFYSQSNTIRVLPGSEYNLFTESSKHLFLNESYKLTMNADRMGYQLEGNKLELTHKYNLLSEGVTFGTIQVPTNGQPIILMADRQTTGGYPKIGQVISVDLPKLAQLKPGDSVNFKLVSTNIAENLLFKQKKYLEHIYLGIKLKL